MTDPIKACAEEIDNGIDGASSRRGFIAHVIRKHFPAPVDSDDTRRLDWLELRYCEVREPLLHGSKLLFNANVSLDDERDDEPSNIRELIDKASGRKPTPETSSSSEGK